MELFDRFEKALEEMVESTFGRLFRSPLQPVEIGKRLQREMELHRSASVSTTYVPNLYTIQLGPDTYAKLSMLCPRLLTEFESFLKAHAAAQHFETVGPITVRLQEEPSVKGNEMRILVTDTPQDAPQPEPVAAAPVATEQTTFLRLVQEHPTVQLTPSLALEVVAGEDLGQRIPLSNGLRIGRGLPNDLPLTDKAVSREHAEIVLQNGEWAIHDRGSANHTYVNGAPIATALLKLGDTITVGQTKMVVR